MSRANQRFEVPEFTEEQIEKRLKTLQRDAPDTTREMAIGSLITSAKWDHQRKVTSTRVKARPEQKERSWLTIQEENWLRNKFYIRMDTEDMPGLVNYVPEGIEAFNSELVKLNFTAQVYRKDPKEGDGAYVYKKLYARTYVPTNTSKDIHKDAIREMFNDKFALAVFYLPIEYEGEIEFTLILNPSHPGPSKVFNVEF